MRPSVFTDDSAFNVNAVFMWTNMAFSYNIQRSGSSENTDQSATLFNETNPVMNFSDKTNSANWIHELGFAYDMVDFMKIYVPVKVNINGSGKTNSTWKDTSTDVTTETITENIAGKYINVDLSPEFIFPASYGPVNEWSAGIGFNMNVYNPGDAINSTTTSEGASLLPTGESKKEVNTVYEDRLHFGATLSAGTTMEWAKEKMTFIVEPSAMLTYDRNQGGTAISTTNSTTVDGQTTKAEIKTYEPTINTFTPVLHADVGMEITPNDWFALRLGFAYNMEWVNTFTSQYESALDKEIKSNSSAFDSTFVPALGMGFIIAEDFELDFDVNYNSSSLLSFYTFNVTATYNF